MRTSLSRRFDWPLLMLVLVLGIFGIVEILKNLENMPDSSAGTTKITSLLPSRDDLRRSAGPIARGSILGSFLGTLPGGGSILSAFASYTVEKRLSKHPERFGKGAIEGVAGPESANNAGAQTSFIPLLTLGLPSHPLMALMMSAMLIQGITPGPNVVTQQPAMFWGIIASMWVGNAMLVVLNLPLVGLWVTMLKIPYRMMLPLIVAFSTIGVFTVSNSSFDLYVLCFFGIIGYAFHKVDCEPAPFLMGFVLGGLLEEYLRRALVFSGGDPLTFVTHPISGSLLLVAVVVLGIVALPSISRKREEIFVEED